MSDYYYSISTFLLSQCSHTLFVGGGVRGWALSKRAGGLPMLARSVAPAGTSKICGRLDDHRRGQRVRAEEPALPGLDVVAGRVHSLRFSEL